MTLSFPLAALTAVKLGQRAGEDGVPWRRPPCHGGTSGLYT